jgi:hypothetical protein
MRARPGWLRGVQRLASGIRLRNREGFLLAEASRASEHGSLRKVRAIRRSAWVGGRAISDNILTSSFAATLVRNGIR